MQQQFKVGDWVRTPHRGIFQIKHEIELSAWEITLGGKAELWYPKVGEILSYPNGYNGASIGRLIEIKLHPEVKVNLAIFENGDTYDIEYCEPFIGELPSLIKDKQCIL